MLLKLLIATVLSKQSPETISLSAGMRIDRSCKIVRNSYRFANEDATGKLGAITISGNDITVDFDGATISGTDSLVEPNRRIGTGITVLGKNVTLRNVRVTGYKIGLAGWSANGLKVVDSDFSYNWKQHLESTPDAEDEADWMSFHKNENDEWLRYGAAIYLRNCDEFKIRDVTATGGQCGLMLSESDRGLVLNSDFSFLSAIGLGMYRSVDNYIMHNRLDWCVRGYSHGIYNRGQDSAGLLMYEQTSRNVIAYNSITHGGDGLFLWAGQSTMDTGQGGCNDNLFYGNDFSHAVTNGIEATFSKNIFAANLVQECWHGLWGGYSYNSRILGNSFAMNSIAIAIEHGQDNSIFGNRFDRDRQAIQFWEKYPQDPNWGYPNNRDTRSRDARIEGNTFANILGPVFRFGGHTNLSVKGNIFNSNGNLGMEDSRITGLDISGNTIRSKKEAYVSRFLSLGSSLGNRLDFTAQEPANTFMQANGLNEENNDWNLKSYLRRFNVSWDGTTVKAEGELAKLKPKPQTGGRKPYLKAGTVRGRRYIAIDEWGPYDFRAPKIIYRSSKTSGGKTNRMYEIMGPRGSWRLLSNSGGLNIPATGTVPGFIEVVSSSSASPSGITLLQGFTISVSSRSTMKDYRGVRLLSPVNVTQNLPMTPIELSWNLKWWNFDSTSQDPRTQSLAFEQAVQKTPVATSNMKGLDLSWPNSPFQNVNSDYFATEAISDITVPPGGYELSVTADDGVRAWLDGRMIMDEWRYSVPKQYRIKLLLGGKHQLKLLHFELNGFATLRASLVPASVKAR